MTSDPLRDAYAAHVKSATSADRNACPSPEALETLARRSERSADRGIPDGRALEHVLTCAHCRSEFDLLRTVVVAGTKETLLEPVARHAASALPRWSSWRALAAASVLIVAAAGGDAWRRQRALNERAPVLRSAGTDSTDVTLISPVSTNDGHPGATVGHFLWRGVPGASAYAVEILDTTGLVLASRVTADTSLSLSDAERTRVVGAAQFDWVVTARRGDGNERRSVLTRVRVSGNP